MSGRREAGVLAGGVVAFALLALAHRHAPVDGWDEALARWVADHLPEPVEWIARPFSWVGGGVGMAFVAVLAAGVLLQRGTRADALSGASAYVVAELTTQLLKRAFDRPRPAFDTVGDLPRTAAFPSGHASVSMAVLVVVASLLGGVRAVRWAVAASVAIGLSRLGLGVHWATDVLAGWALGAAVAVAVLGLGGALRGRR